jgi:hypothetical protein
MTTMGTPVGEGTGASAASAATPDTAGAHKPRAGDWVIAAALLALFVVAFVLAQDWPFRAALFPMIISTAGALMAVIKLIGLAVATLRARRTPQGAAIVPSERAADLPALPADSSPEAVNIRTAAVAAEEKRGSGEASPDGTPADLQIVDDDQEDDESLEYVFATAGARAWGAALGWITAFFVSFFVLGAFITVPLFALVYLRVAGRNPWWAAAVYAAVTGAVIFVVFRYVVFLPLPTGVIPFLQI